MYTYTRNNKQYTLHENAEYPVIPLTKDQYAIVSLEDYDELIKYNWYTGTYPQTNVTIRGEFYISPSGNKKTKQKTILMHRVIIKDVPRGMIVDHINGNKFDNRRENLRVIKHKYNAQAARRVPINSPTGVIGIGLQRNKFRARITVRYKTIYLGTYNTIEEAIAARDAAKIKYHSF